LTTSLAYYRSVKDAFLAHDGADDPPSFPPADTYPEPVEHCDVCRWAPMRDPARRTTT
jgi:hypothetical protein